LYLAADDTTPGAHSETSDVFGCEDNDTFADEHLDSTTEVCDVKRHAAKFILKIKEECKLTQSSVDIIVSSVKGLWAQAMDNIRQKLADHLPDQVDENLFGCPFEGLETQYLQQKYYPGKGSGIELQKKIYLHFSVIRMGSHDTFVL